VENQIVCWWGITADHDRGDVSALANHTENRGVVSEYGIPGPDRIVLRHGHRPTDTLLRDRLHRSARSVAVPELVRGCGLLRQFPPPLGLAGGESALYFELSAWGRWGETNCG